MRDISIFYMTPEHIHEWVDNVHFPGLMRRMYGTLQNPNLLGEYLLFVLSVGGLGMIQVLKAKDWKRFAYMALAVICMLLCLVLTYSRGMWLSLAVVVFVAGICVERRLLYALLAVPLVLFFYHGEVSSRLWSLFSGQDTRSCFAGRCGIVPCTWWRTFLFSALVGMHSG